MLHTGIAIGKMQLILFVILQSLNIQYKNIIIKAKYYSGVSSFLIDSPKSLYQTKTKYSQDEIIMQSYGLNIISCLALKDSKRYKLFP